MEPHREDSEIVTMDISYSHFSLRSLATFSAPKCNQEYMIFNSRLGPFYLDHAGSYRPMMWDTDIGKGINYFIDSENERLLVEYYKRVKGETKAERTQRRSKRDGKKYYSLLFDLNSKNMISDEFCDLTSAVTESDNNPPE